MGTILLIDMSQIVIAAVSAIQSSPKTRQDLTEDFIRHVIVGSLRNIRLQFSSESELETIICCDNRNNWRKKIFPYYKANRARIKAAAPFDWEAFMEFYDRIKEELKTYFPYKLLQVEGCEADDIIGILTNIYGEENKIIIVSSDSDFSQLHSSNVVQYSPMKKNFVKFDNPKVELYRKIINGDAGDGIPNVLSDDDTFVTPGKRQKPMRSERLREIFEAVVDDKESTLPSDVQRNLARNKRLITLSNEVIPSSLVDEVLDKYKQYQVPRGRIFDYLYKFNLKQILSDPRGL